MQPQDKSHMRQAHGMTQEEMRELQQKQLENPDGVVKKIPANKDSNYEIEEHNKHLVHVLLEHPSYHQTTGVKLSKPFVQMYYPAEFERMAKDNLFAGHTVKVIHIPENVEKEMRNRYYKDVQQNDATGQINPDALMQSSNYANRALSSLSKPELQEYYAELYGEAANEETGVKVLREKIQEKLDFNAEELKSLGTKDNQ